MLKIRKFLLPTKLYPTRSPYSMKPEGITVHNTWNTAPAINEASYVRINPLHVSYHYVVDEKEAIQVLPLDRNGWHAGDGRNGKGNRKTIGVEIARSRSDLNTFLKAEKNGATLVALLLKQYNWGLERVYKHQDWSGKYCPHRTLDLGYERFLKMVQAELDELNKAFTPVSSIKPSVPSKVTKKTVQQIAREVIEGRWANGTERKARLTKAGYNYNAVQAQVSILLGNKSTPSLKPNAVIAQEVLNGKWGNGQDRKNRLTKAGYDYPTIQAAVNKITSDKKRVTLKPIRTIALEVLDGKWGNGQDRKNRLKKAGYDAAAVQKEVNKLI